MMQRYMLYQIASALYGFLQGKDISEEDRNQAECEYNMACLQIMKSIQYPGRRKRGQA